MVGITVAEPIVPIYLDRAALRKLKMQDGKDIKYFIREMNIFTKMGKEYSANSTL